MELLKERLYDWCCLWGGLMALNQTTTSKQTQEQQQTWTVVVDTNRSTITSSCSETKFSAVVSLTQVETLPQSTWNVYWLGFRVWFYVLNLKNDTDLWAVPRATILQYYTRSLDCWWERCNHCRPWCWIIWTGPADEETLAFYSTSRSTGCTTVRHN